MQVDGQPRENARQSGAVGLFDLRCGISRVSTLWRPSGLKRKVCTMCLVEQIGEAWEPCTPPVSGTYDRYGAIELWAEDVSPYTEWVGDRLWRLFEVGALTTSWPQELDHEARGQSSRVERMLHHGAETAYNGVKLAIDGRPIRAFLALEMFAEAIKAAAPAPPATLAEALARLFPEGGVGRARFADAPAGALPQLRRWACVREFMRPHGGLPPINPGDGSQHSDDQIRRSVRGAYRRPALAVSAGPLPPTGPKEAR